MARLLLLPIAVIMLLAAMAPLVVAALGGGRGLQAAFADPALASALRTSAEGAAVAATLGLALALTAALAVWQAAQWLRGLVLGLAVLLLVTPAPGFTTLDMVTPLRLTALLQFTCAVARAAAFSLLILSVWLRGVPAGLRRSAMAAGASRSRAWRDAVLAPLLAPMALAFVVSALVVLGESPAAAVLAPHLDMVDAWIAPAALLLAGGSLAAISVLLRRPTQ